jgi:hypothetical protein
VGPVIEGTGPGHHHPRYGEVQYGGSTRKVRGGSIDVMNLIERASICLNLKAVADKEKTTTDKEGEKKGGRNEENKGMVEEDNPGEVRWPMGGIDRKPHFDVDSVSGLPIGVTDGRSPVEPEQTYTDKTRKVHLEIPMTLPRNGRNYTKCSPLAATVGFGGRQIKCLMDPDSNTSIVDAKVLKAAYPDAVVNDSVQISIHGIGQSSTMGWIVLPLTIQSADDQGPIEVELDVEFHVMRDFAPGLLLGLDTMIDYDVDLCLSDLEGSARGYKFALDAPYRPFKSVLVKTAKKVIIPGRTATVIPVKSAMLPGFDYVIEPYYTVLPGTTCGPQLPKGLANSGLRAMVYVNDTEHPMVLDKNQAIAHALMCTVDTEVVETSLRIDWSDLVKPRGSPAQVVGAKAPAAFDLDQLKREVAGESTSALELASSATWFSTDRCYENELCFTADGRERPRRPRSIPDADAARIAAAAPRRASFEQFATPLDDPEMEIPSIELASDDIETILDSDFMIDPGLSDDRKSDLIGLLRTYIASFSKGARLGKVRGFKANIPLKDGMNAPPAQPNRPQGPAKRQVVDEFIDQMLRWDVIEDSSSPTGAGIVLVKQNGKWRFCVDFRMLNDVTVGDSYPMLRSDYVFSAMGGKRFFSTLDCLKGYHQLELQEEDRWKSAFITHRGLYQFKRLPFGLKNAPAIYQRFMDQLLGSLRWNAALVYIDDVIIYSDTWTEHLHHLKQLLTSAEMCNLTFSLPKCRFGFAEITMLGMGLSRYGLHTIKDRVKAVLDLPAPSTMGDLHRMLGMFGYYRMFIRNFAKVAAPLNALKKGDGARDYDSKKPLAPLWTDSCQDAFDELKDRLSSAPILAHPRFDRSFILYTDASNIAFGAVLAQVWTEKDYDFAADDDTELPVACALEGMNWDAAYLEDKAFQTAYKRLKNSTEEDPNYRLDDDGSLRYRSTTGEKVCLPAGMVKAALQVAHDALGHFGFEKTYERLSSTYYRPGLSTAVKQYIQYCPLCLKNKTSHAKKEGLLQPIDPPV